MPPLLSPDLIVLVIVRLLHPVGLNLLIMLSLCLLLLGWPGLLLLLDASLNIVVVAGLRLLSNPLKGPQQAGILNRAIC